MSDLKIVQEGPTRGAWLTVPQGLLSLVNESRMDAATYVGVSLGKPEVAHSLPYAMSFSKEGELMLQMPNQENPREPFIVKMSQVVALVKAAKGL